MADKLTGFRNRVLPADLTAPYTAYKDAKTGPAIDRTLQVYLPEVYPIPSATEFNLLATKATVAVEAGTDIGLTLDLAANNIGIIRGVNIFISDMLNTTNVTWTVTVAGGPAPGYNNLAIFPRTSPFVGNSFDSFIRLPQGAKVRVTFSNTDGGSYTVGASLSGWSWPTTLGDLWTKKGGAVQE